MSQNEKYFMYAALALTVFYFFKVNKDYGSKVQINTSGATIGVRG